MDEKQREALELLGLTQEQLRERAIERISKDVLFMEMHDEDGEPCISGTGLLKALEAKVKEAIDRKVTVLAEEHVLPNVTKMVEDLTLQETNRWGEKVGEPVTFIEYLIQRAEVFMTEKVDYQGRAKGERGADSYSWKASQTRVAHMIDKHLQYSIATAMESALKTANGSIVKGLEEAVKVKLDEIAKKLRVELKGVR